MSYERDLAGGGAGTVHPLTTAPSRRLTLVYDKPVMHNPLSTLILALITDEAANIRFINNVCAASGLVHVKRRASLRLLGTDCQLRSVSHR
jgi:hypothetical protein